METKDPYMVLGLSGEASQEDIRKAHRTLVRKYHPDTNLEDPRAEERFKEVQQAHEMLSNHEKRQEYEKSSRTSPRGNSGVPGAGAGRRTGGGTTHTVDLSELLGKLANLSRDGSGRRKDGGFQLRGEKEAHLGKLLGEKISRISALLGADPACLSKLLDEISSPTSRAETSIEASASVHRLTSPHTTHAKPCEHVGRSPLLTELPRRGLLGNTPFATTSSLQLFQCGYMLSIEQASQHPVYSWVGLLLAGSTQATVEEER